MPKFIVEASITYSYEVEADSIGQAIGLVADGIHGQPSKGSPTAWAPFPVSFKQAEFKGTDAEPVFG
jgi:hypothetical protein